MDGDVKGRARLSGGALLGGVAVGAVVAALAGWVILDRTRPLPEPETPAAAQTTAAQAPAPEAPKTASAAPEAAKPAEAAPSFDTFRAAPDGSVTLAGGAAPGAEVEVLMEGQPVATATADATGAFALVFEVPPSDAPRALTLRVAGVPSAETLVIRPGLVTEDTAPGAGAAPQTLVADASGVRVMTPATAAPGESALIIDTIAHDSGADVTVNGRGGVPGSFLRAYLDNREVAGTEVAADGSWRVQLEAVAPGDHTLRVDVLDAAGKVIARAEAPLRRDAPEELAAAAPAAGAGVVPQGTAEGAAGVPASGAGLDRRALVAPGPGVAVSGAGLARKPAEAAPAAAPASAPALRVLTVVRGQSLWAIARETYGDGFLYVRVFEANRDQIRDPDLIYPGQVFTLPQ